MLATLPTLRATSVSRIVRVTSRRSEISASSRKKEKKERLTRVKTGNRTFPEGADDVWYDINRSMNPGSHITVFQSEVSQDLRRNTLNKLT